MSRKATSTYFMLASRGGVLSQIVDPREKKLDCCKASNSNGQGGRLPTDVESAYLGVLRTPRIVDGLCAGIAYPTEDRPCRS
jgi:hypothetical protein